MVQTRVLVDTTYSSDENRWVYILRAGPVEI